MGCILCCPDAESDSNNLTADDRRRLRQIWPYMLRQKPTIFSDILANIVDRSPYARTVFGISTNEALTTACFRHLAMATEAFFHQIIMVHKLDDAKIIVLTRQLGAKHTSYTMQGFKSTYWDIFAICFMQAIDGTSIPGRQRKRADYIYAWQKLILTVVEEMRQGYLEEQRKHPPPMPYLGED